MNTGTSPLVSVVIPYYNCEKYIEEALASVEAQCYRNFEMILVNDGSTVSSTLFVEKLLENKPDIHYIHQKNKGLAATRNVGAKLATGEFLLFLDADNKIKPDYLKKTVPVLLSNPSCKLVYTKAELFEAETGEWKLPPYIDFCDLLLGNKIDALALIRKDDFNHLGGFDESLSSHEDWDYWIRLLQHGGEVIRLDEILFYYRKRLDKTSITNQLLNDRNQERTSWQKIYIKHSDLYMKHQLGFFDLLYNQKNKKSWLKKLIKLFS
ncbi:MAG: glycosyltransferase family A protein [Moraxella sp.]|nr:glycosyltransferase family A protein [Moraxella sp.]